MSAIIVDIDNCIASDQWRRCHVKHDAPTMFERYHDYHSLSAFDGYPRNFRRFAEADTIIYVTSRPEHYRAITLQWFKKHHITPQVLRMRPNNDERHSCLFKETVLTELLAEGYPIIAAYDDHIDVVEMYLRKGIPSTVVSIDSESVEGRR